MFSFFRIVTPTLHNHRAQDAALILASASPRRRELLSRLGADYRAIATDAEERDDPAPGAVVAALPAVAVPLANHPTLLAWRKAHAVSRLVASGDLPGPGASGAGEQAESLAAHPTAPAVILGADTIVVLDGEVLNKPRDVAHARAMLGQLSGRTHTVYTGICVIGGAGERGSEGAGERGSGGADSSLTLHPASVTLTVVASEVEVAPLSAAEIGAYVATGEPMDKAGAYGIQGLGGRLVRTVYGSYTNVVGLPLRQVYALLTAAGVAGLRDPDEAYHGWLKSQGKEPLPCPPTHP